ncbi:MAG: glutamate--cysteine ligase, partial [Rhodospirillales bacterium 12-71-4]
MSNPGEADLTPITSTRQLSEWFAAGSKPKAAWRIGTEHEKFGFARAGFAPPPYEPGGIRAMLDGLQAEGWAPILDSGHVIGLKRDGGSVSLEPGGQFELSGAPMADLHETRVELAEHLRGVHA